MMKIAGGDQKNRSCVIPICAGFKRETYIYSKFLVIAPIAFVAACIGYGIAYGVSGVLFTQRAELVDVLFSCLAFCVFIAFIACFMLFLGSITGKAGISAVCIFFFNTIVMMILPSLKLNHYNPFALQSFATSFGDVDKIDYFASIGITLAVCVLFAIIAAKIFKKKRLV
jgi:ABC-2 type transport system permease protein